MNLLKKFWKSGNLLFAKHTLLVTLVLFFSVILPGSLLSRLTGSITVYSDAAVGISAGTPISRDFKIPDEEADVPQKSTLWRGPRLVMIDAGHGGTDPGAQVGNIREKDINLDIALRLNRLLKQKDILTAMTRTGDVSADKHDRISAANRKKAALYLSIHCDWYSESKYNGASVLYYPSADLSSGNLTELEYAGIIRKAVAKSVEIKDRGLIDRENLTVLRYAKMPSIILETGFLSNENDRELLSRESYRQRLAESLAEGMEKALSRIDAR